MSDNIGSRDNCFGEGTSLKNDERDNEGFSLSSEEVENSGALGKKTECRICGEEDFVKHTEAPCACNGTLKHAHRKCIQKWCNEKNDTICEICNKPYDGYTVAQEETIPEQLMNMGPFEDCGTPQGMRIAIIRTLVLISGTIITMLYAYDLEVKRDLGDIPFAFSSNHIFFVRLMALVMPIYAISWVTHLAIIWSERRVRQP